MKGDRTMLEFIVGLFVGAVVTLVTMAVFSIGKDD